MIVFPNAKINIGLNVVAKRSDGYHDLETVFYPVGICDVIELTPAGERTTFACHPPLDGCPDADNLVMRAVESIRRDFYIPHLAIDLVKRIPSGAGLGGGSADATFTLRCLNDLFSLGLDDEALEARAARLGADCPFFVRNRPVFATGTGNVFTPVQLSLKGWHIVVVKPDIFVSTREAFSQVVPHPSSRSLAEDVMLPVEEWRHVISNDFEPGVFAVHPRIGEVKEQLYAAGAAYASMSGSGSAVYGLFKKPACNVGGLFNGCYIWTSEL